MFSVDEVFTYHKESEFIKSNMKGVQKVRGKVPSYSYFVNQLN